MSEDGLPLELRDFVVRHFTSVEQLELLILLASRPEKAWTIGQLVLEIRSSRESIQQSVRHLQAGGFLVEDGETFRYVPVSPTAPVIHELAKAYREYRVRIIAWIYSGSGALRAFSDAFKIKPKE